MENEKLDDFLIERVAATVGGRRPPFDPATTPGAATEVAVTWEKRMKREEANRVNNASNLEGSRRDRYGWCSRLRSGKWLEVEGKAGGSPIG